MAWKLVCWPNKMLLRDAQPRSNRWTVCLREALCQLWGGATSVFCLRSSERARPHELQFRVRAGWGSSHVGMLKLLPLLSCCLEQLDMLYCSSSNTPSSLGTMRILPIVCFKLSRSSRKTTAGWRNASGLMRCLQLVSVQTGTKVFALDRLDAVCT